MSEYQDNSVKVKIKLTKEIVFYIIFLVQVSIEVCLNGQIHVNIRVRSIKNHILDLLKQWWFTASIVKSSLSRIGFRSTYLEMNIFTIFIINACYCPMF